MLIRGGRVIDPANGIDKVADILVEMARWPPSAKT
jgi:predicted amidohydrolase